MCGRYKGWTIFGVFDLEDVEDEKLTPFLAILLIKGELWLNFLSLVVSLNKYWVPMNEVSPNYQPSNLRLAIH